MSSIALRQHILKVGDSPFAHNYLVFYDDDGNVVGEFHGLAAHPVTDAFVPIGRSSNNLRARRFEGKNWFRKASRRNPSGKGRTTKTRHGGRRPGTRMTRSTAGA